MTSKRKVFPTAPVALSLFALYCCAWLVLPPCYNEHSFVASIIDKHKALERAHSPKIVFVGGSNLALGLDSEAVEKSTGEDVVNMGVSRLFGLRYCLEEIKSSVQKNDTIVIVPEYENFFGEMNGSAHLMNVPLLMPRAIPWVWAAYSTSPQRVWALASDLVGVMSFKWGWWREHVIQFTRRRGNDAVVASMLYNPAEPPNFTRENFTTCGDFIGHLNQQPPSSKYLKLCDGLGSAFDPECLKVLNQFNDFAKSRGAQVVMLPPPLPKGLYVRNHEKVDFAYRHCREQLNFPVLSSPEEYIFANSDFFNSLYHLTRKAREERTARLVRDLQVHAQTAAENKTGIVRL